MRPTGTASNRHWRLAAKSGERYVGEQDQSAAVQDKPIGFRYHNLRAGNERNLIAAGNQFAINFARRILRRLGRNDINTLEDRFIIETAVRMFGAVHHDQVAGPIAALDNNGAGIRHQVTCILDDPGGVPIAAVAQRDYLAVTDVYAAQNQHVLATDIARRDSHRVSERAPARDAANSRSAAAVEKTLRARKTGCRIRSGSGQQ